MLQVIIFILVVYFLYICGNSEILNNSCCNHLCVFPSSCYCGNPGSSGVVKTVKVTHPNGWVNLNDLKKEI